MSEIVKPRKRAIKPPAAEEPQAAAHGAREITAVYPEQVFSPYPYNSFRCGGIFYKTVVFPGESDEEAYARAWAHVSKLAREQYTQVRKDFYDRYEGRVI